MRMIRYLAEDGTVKLAAVSGEGAAWNLPYKDVVEFLEYSKKVKQSPLQLIREEAGPTTRIAAEWTELALLSPIEAPEVWAAGVTYERSRTARNSESTSGKSDEMTVYDKVYNAERPELFMKSTPLRTVGPGGAISLRTDSTWQVPEPELGLVVGSDGEIWGYTAGNDVSCRDIEGENPLYLPQAKIWRNSCSIGPSVLLAESVSDPYAFEIVCRIRRGGHTVFTGSANTRQLKRKYEELVSFLLRDNVILPGTVLLTGTCIVPPDEFTLASGDRIEIEITGIGTLVNTVA